MTERSLEEEGEASGLPWGNLGALGVSPWVWGVRRRCRSPQFLTSIAEVLQGDLGDVGYHGQSPISGVGSAPSGHSLTGGGRGSGLGLILGARRAVAGARGSIPVGVGVVVGQAEQQQVGAGKASLRGAVVLGEEHSGGSPRWRD